MTIYISMLRGVNVSGQKKVKMNDLSALYETLGLKNIVTYIQSGNVIFETTERSTDKLKELLESAIEKHFDFHSPVIIRNKDAINTIIEQTPFASIDIENEGTKYLVTLLASTPDKNKASELLSVAREPEQLIVKGKEVYLHCPNGYGKSKLTNTFIEKKLGIEATTRNWKTLIKLQELAENN